MLQNHRYSKTKIMQSSSSPVLPLSPSFNSYSSSTTHLADIASRVVEEFRAESTSPDTDEGGGGCYNCDNNPFLTGYEDSLDVRNDEEENEEEDEDEEEEFEFAVAGRDFFSSPAPADEIFYNGQIRPCFPLFNQDLLLESVEYEEKYLNLSNRKAFDAVPPSPATGSPARLSLRKLFIEDREPPSSCSSSEADELEGLTPGSYCVWNPKTASAAAEEGRCKKSNSTGSSKRWRFKDLLYRSHSDGRDNFVFLSHPRQHTKKSEEKTIKKTEKSSAVAPEVNKAAGKIAAPYLKEKEGERRRVSFLPYRQDLVGLFSNVNGLGRSLHPI